MDNSGEPDGSAPSPTAPVAGSAGQLAEPTHRPPPPRPEFHVEPRHAGRGAAAPGAVRAALWCWVASFAVLVGIAAATVFDLADVRRALEASLAGESPSTSHEDIADAVSLTLLGCASAAALLVVAALIGLQLLRFRRAAGRIVLTVVGALSVGAAFAFWSLLADATDATGGVLQWAPTVYVVFVVAGVGLLYAPTAGSWLRRRG
ncbi:hypothetical protein ACFYVR_21955 [Rhodococcus sp. NPDC003318]|uniref:hypothetical protein n=1 Tax=Rhodococcus sp. NPDC003318 TaxID=3364503 RepID=UPI0036BF459F